MTSVNTPKISIDVNEWDRVAYIVGGGPSLKNFDWSDLDGKFVFAINRSYEVLPNAQIVYFTDKDWWLEHQLKLKQHSGMKVKGSLGNTWANDPAVIEYTLTGPHGIESVPNNLRHGYNSAYACLNLAVQLGFTKIYLLGLDMKWGTKGQQNTSHWHSGHKRIDAESVYDKMKKAYSTIVAPLQTRGVEVINVTEDSTLDAFKKQTFVETFGQKYENKVMKTSTPEPKLLGDHLEEALKKVGADKVAQVYQRITKKPCNCGQRKAVLNQLHARLKQNR